MVDIFLTNSLTRKKEKFAPLNPPNVGVYTCGPTVYDYAHIGNFRTYVTSDLLSRALEFNGYHVKHVMNLTDVGHLTGDNLGDADLGEDRVEVTAKREGKTAWDIAKFYSDAFLKDAQNLNIKMPSVLPRATAHIKEQVKLVETLREKGFTYKTSDGIYFDTVSFEKKTGKKYGELSTLDEIRAGARVEKNPEKKNARDFALWKFSYKGGRSFDSAQDDSSNRRHMEWESPWGVGFPGWHIECSAMSMKYLGDSFDIHVGGEDLRSTHHPNEIAQSEAATGKKFVKYWLHVTFLKVEGKRMSKSLGNVFTISDIRKKGYQPLSLRYLYLTAHYKDSLNFTWRALSSAQKTLEKLRAFVGSTGKHKKRVTLSEDKGQKIDDLRQKFTSAINNDLSTPQALAVLWEALKSNIPSADKYDLVLAFDEVLGLNLKEVPKVSRVSKDIKKLIEDREELRKKGKFKEADEIRKKVREMGYLIEDTQEGPEVKPAPHYNSAGPA